MNGTLCGVAPKSPLGLPSTTVMHLWPEHYDSLMNGQYLVLPMAIYTVALFAWPKIDRFVKEAGVKGLMHVATMFFVFVHGLATIFLGGSWVHDTVVVSLLLTVEFIVIFHFMIAFWSFFAESARPIYSFLANHGYVSPMPAFTGAPITVEVLLKTLKDNKPHVWEITAQYRKDDMDAALLLLQVKAKCTVTVEAKYLLNCPYWIYTIVKEPQEGGDDGGQRCSDTSSNKGQ